VSAGSESSRAKRQLITSWDELGWVVEHGGRRFSLFSLGEDDDPVAPVVVLAEFPPGFVVDPHTHASDYAEVILDGSLRVGRTWYGPGDLRVVTAGTGYGPQLAGESGCRLLFVYRDRRIKAIPLRPGRDRGIAPDVDAEASTFDWVGFTVL
jgi:hypothetical protein